MYNIHKINKKRDIKKIIKLYTVNDMTLSQIGIIFSENHKLIARILRRNGITVYRKNISSKRENKLKYIIGNLKYNVDIEWLASFKDIEKIIFLNRARKTMFRYIPTGKLTTEFYISYIEKFYYDKKFNYLYKKWISSGDRWIKPSLDHKIPLSKGGTNDLKNIRFISWFENRAKYNMDYREWENIKKRIHEYF
jgi:hypothetical protein